MLRTLDGKTLPEASVLMNLDVNLYSEKPVTEAKDAIELIGNKIGFQAREHIAMLCLDINYHPICAALLQTGDEKECVYPLRTLCQTAVLSNASYVIMFHNHPCYDAIGRKVPAADIRSTSVVYMALDLVGVTLFDHIILHPERMNGENVLYSYSMRLRKPLLFRQKVLDRMARRVPSTEDELDLKNHSNRLLWNVIGAPDRNLNASGKAYLAYTPEEFDEALELLDK